MAATKYAIGVDLGGTKILAAVVDDHGNVLGSAKKSTQGEKGPDAVIKRIVKASEEALEDAKIKKDHITAIGVGAPGLVDSARGIVVNLTNLPGWHNVDLARHLRSWHSATVVISNDVRVAAIGEHRKGAGRGAHSMVAVFIGTGIGGGIIIHDQPWVGFRSSAGEVGHMIVAADGPFAPGAGIRGGIEALASRSAIERDLRAALAAGRKSVLPELMREKQTDMITSSILAKAISKNDALTLEVMRRAARYLGLHAASLINVLDPEVLIYGGGVVESLGEWLLAQIRDVAFEHALNKNQLNQVRIVEAELGDRAGVIGAALVALDAARAG